MIWSEIFEKYHISVSSVTVGKNLASAKSRNSWNSSIVYIKSTAEVNLLILPIGVFLWLPLEKPSVILMLMVLA